MQGPRARHGSVCGFCNQVSLLPEIGTSVRMWPIVLAWARAYAPMVVLPFAGVVGFIGETEMGSSPQICTKGHQRKKFVKINFWCQWFLSYNILVSYVVEKGLGHLTF